MNELRKEIVNCRRISTALKTFTAVRKFINCEINTARFPSLDMFLFERNLLLLIRNKEGRFSSYPYFQKFLLKKLTFIHPLA